jgi:hypothetical protein
VDRRIVKGQAIRVFEKQPRNLQSVMERAGGEVVLARIERKRSSELVSAISPWPVSTASLHGQSPR